MCRVTCKVDQSTLKQRPAPGQLSNSADPIEHTPGSPSTTHCELNPYLGRSLLEKHHSFCSAAWKCPCCPAFQHSKTDKQNKARGKNTVKAEHVLLVERDAKHHWMIWQRCPLGRLQLHPSSDFQNILQPSDSHIGFNSPIVIQIKPGKKEKQGGE